MSWAGTGMFKRRAERDDDATAPQASEVRPETVVRSTVRPKFMAAVARRAVPVVVDLGAVVGLNVGFLSERLDCTIHVHDLFADVEAHARGRARDPDVGPLALASHLLPPLESVDGILCWDLFDYLDPPTGRSLAASLTGLLRPGGALYGLFGTTPINSPTTRVSCWRPTTVCGDPHSASGPRDPRDPPHVRPTDGRRIRAAQESFPRDALP